MSLLPAQGEGRDYRGRYVWVLAVALLALAALSGRLYWLQVARGDYYAMRSRSNFVKRVELAADRGMILDRQGTILVDDRPAFDVDITLAFSPDPQLALSNLADGLDVDLEAYEGWLQRVDGVRGLGRFKPVPIVRDVTRAQLDWIEAHATELDGIDVRIRPRRNYRQGRLLAHVLGYMNEISRRELERSRAAGTDYELGDMVGREGLEARYEEVLRGKDGWEQVAVDAKGRRIEVGFEDDPLIPEAERVRESVPGENLVLTVDARLQRVAERSFDGDQGAVVALDAKTGEVLALVSIPTYDPNLMSGGITAKEMRSLIEDPYKPMVHRAIQAHYPPGSTFKPVTALAALKAGAVTPRSVTTCKGGYRLGRRRWRCWKESGHGPETLGQALQHSCDTYFYAIGDRIGLDPIAEMAHDLGFGNPTGLGLPHEVPGIIPTESWHEKVSPEGYQRGFALNSSIGQGSVNVTPLQLAVAYAALGNGGTVYRPQIIRRIEAADGRVVQDFEPEVMNQLDVPKADLDAVVDGLVRVVMSPGGTAYWQRPRRLEVAVAGKTGTAQVVRMHGARVDSADLEYWSRDHAWFAAFAPADDPEIAVAVINEHGGHGGSAAAPTAFAVIETYFELKAEDAALQAVEGAPITPPMLDPDPTSPLHAGGDESLAPGFELPPLDRG